MSRRFQFPCRFEAIFGGIFSGSPKVNFLEGFFMFVIWERMVVLSSEHLPKRTLTRRSGEALPSHNHSPRSSSAPELRSLPEPLPHPEAPECPRLTRPIRVWPICVGVLVWCVWLWVLVSRVVVGAGFTCGCGCWFYCVCVHFCVFCCGAKGWAARRVRRPLHHKPPGFHSSSAGPTKRTLLVVHVRESRQQFHEKTSPRAKKRAKMGAGEGQTRAKFWAAVKRR